MWIMEGILHVEEGQIAVHVYIYYIYMTVMYSSKFTSKPQTFNNTIYATMLFATHRGLGSHAEPAGLTRLS